MIVKRMNKFKTDKPFTNEELLNMDIIHNSNTKLFKDQNDSSYIIKDFISEDERSFFITSSIIILLYVKSQSREEKLTSHLLTWLL